MQIQDIFSDKQAVKDILSSSNFDEKTITALLEAEVRVGLLVGDVAATLDISSQSFTEWIESALFTRLKKKKSQDVFETCDRNLLKRYMKSGTNPAGLNMTMDYIISKLCASAEETFPQMAQYLNVEKIASFLQTAYSLQPDVLAKSSNMTREELNAVAFVMEGMNQIYPEIFTLLSNLIKEVNTTQMKEKLNVTDIEEESFPYIANNLLCGEPLRPLTPSKFWLLNPDLSSSTWEPVEARGCWLIKNSLKKFRGGVIIWEILESILQGEITFTPVNSVTNTIIEKASRFFIPIATFRDKLKTFGDLHQHLKNMDYYKYQSKIMTNLFHSTFFYDWTESKINEIYDTSFLKNTNVTDINSIIKSNIHYFKVTDEISSALECVNTQRFRAVKSEESILEDAKKGIAPFLAGIVFHDEYVYNDSSTYKETASTHIQYKIRMDVDSVPQTTSIKEQSWVPGPDGDFYYNMRYFWGFLQIQDLLDNAIIEIQTGYQSQDRVFMQQFPYPCFMRNNFLSALYTAQLLPIALVFGFAVVVCIFVNQFIWERESGNLKLLEIRGLDTKLIWLSNFIVMDLVLIVSSTLLTAVLYWGNLLPLSQPLIIWIMLLAYSFSCTMFIFLMTSLLKKSSSGSVITFLIFILTLLPFFVIMALSNDVGTGTKVASNIFMSSAFGSSILYITSLEQKQLGMDWSNLSISPIESDSFNILFCFIFMLCDGILYGMIGLIFVQITNKTESLLLFSRKGKPKQPTSYTVNDKTDSTFQGIQLINISKEYQTGRNKRLVAVNDLTIQFHSNEITGLLGHNGAGKTTTMGILTGMLKPTSGKILKSVHALEINGKMSTHDIGYCPQQGILYENMTVKEHLMLYANIGKTDKLLANSHVKDLMEKMNLLEKERTLAQHLSEGLRRCLAVGMAFAGNSALVVLDEPTSGVDSAARRRIWDFILKCKANRTIIVSTHHMDEAEILCDKIAILHKGKLVSHGTPSQLLEKYTNCIQLRITKSLCDEENLINEQNSALQSNIDQRVHEMVPNCVNIAKSSLKVVYNLPLGEHEDIGKYFSLFDTLEKEKDSLHISSFSVSSPSLEEIFSTVTWESSDTDTTTEYNRIQTKNQSSNQFKNEDNMSSESIHSRFQDSKKIVKKKTTAKTVNKIYGLLLKRFWNMFGDKISLLTSFSVSLLLLIIAMVVAIIRPDTLSPPILLTPSLYGPGSLSFTSMEKVTSVYSSMLAPPGIGTTCMNPVNFVAPHTKCVNEIPVMNSEVFNQKCQCDHFHWTCGEDQAMAKEISFQYTNTTDTVYFLSSEKMPNSWIYETHYKYIEKLFGGWKFGGSDNFVYFNNKGFHSSAAYLNALNNARLRSFLEQNSSVSSSSYGITTYNHPFRRTANQATSQNILQHISDYILALLLVAVVSFLPSKNIIYLIVERTTDEKQVQRSFGIKPMVYWTSAFLWDSLITLVFVACSAIIIKAFGVEALSDSSNLAASLLLIFCYCTCMNCLVYILEKGFQEPSLGQIVTLTVAVFIGIGTLVVMLLLFFFWWIRPIVEARKLLNIVLLVLPPYAVGRFYLLLLMLSFPSVFSNYL